MEPCSAGKSTKCVLFSWLWHSVSLCFGKRVRCVGSEALSQTPADTYTVGQGKVSHGKGRGKMYWQWLTPRTRMFLLWFGSHWGRECPSIQSLSTNRDDFEWFSGVRCCSLSTLNYGIDSKPKCTSQISIRVMKHWDGSDPLSFIA